jgi:hypothetical protein
MMTLPSVRPEDTAHYWVLEQFVADEWGKKVKGLHKEVLTALGLVALTAAAYLLQSTSSTLLVLGTVTIGLIGHAGVDYFKSVRKHQQYQRQLMKNFGY